MSRRVSLLLTLVVALEFSIKQTFYARAENLHPITYVTAAEQSTLNGTNDLVLEAHVMEKKVRDLDHDEFQSIKRLKKLVISNQRMNESWLEEKDYLFTSSTLETLHLTGCHLARLPTNAFARMPNLTILSLARNRLDSIKLSTLESMKQLEVLDLSANYFSRFSVSRTLTQLRILNLTDNFVYYLKAIRSKSLVKLDVSGNRIFKIREDDLAGLPALHTLIITWNRLKQIQPLAFAGINRLTALDLSNNEKLTNLPIFKMSQSGQKAYGLFSLDCANCGINEITPRTLNTLTNLVKLNLAHNNLKNLPDGFFGNLTSLQSLDLTNNSISWIPNDMFFGAKSLNFLSLEGNPLMKLSLMPFRRTPRLSTLNVARCGLKHLWDTTNGILRSLRYFFLAENSIERITRAELEVTPNLSHMDIAENPFVADKNFQEFAKQLENKNVTLITTFEYEEGQWNANNSLQQLEKSQNSIQSPKDNASESVFNQNLNITTESPKNQTVNNEESTITLRISDVIVILILSFAGGACIFFVLWAIAYSLYWDNSKICKKRQVKSPSDWCNLPKCLKIRRKNYKQLKEETVSTVNETKI